MFKASVYTNNEALRNFEDTQSFNSRQEAEHWLNKQLAKHPKMYGHIVTKQGMHVLTVEGAECCGYCWNDHRDNDEFYPQRSECPVCHDKWADVRIVNT